MRMRNKILVNTVFLLVSCLTLPVFAKPLNFYAEDLPPYHYYDTKGKPAGALVEVVEAVSKVANVEVKINLLPFARGYQMLRSQPNNFMFSLLRNPARESLFQWVGQVYKTDAWLVGLKDQPALEIDSLEQAKKSMVGTIRGYYSEIFLKQAGFKESQNLALSVNYDFMWHMLFRQRIDYVLTNNMALNSELSSLGLDPNSIQRYFKIAHFPSELFIVTHLTTAEKIVQPIRVGLEQIKRSGQYQQIMDKWSL